MSNETFAIFIYIFVSFSWIAYLLQEMFITGSSALNMSIAKDEGERRQIQVATGIHFDGIEVWLIAALTVTFGAFPLVFATTLSYLYVPFFLLVYALIGRGISIEVIYKIDSKKWVKTMVITWLVSSVLIIFILGIFMSNIFLGFPLGADGMEGSFLKIFNVTSISGGLLFVALALVAGAGWIHYTTSGDLGDRAIYFVKKVGIIYMVPIFVLLVFMGYNNTDASIFIGELFTKSKWLFVLPILTVASAIHILYYGYKQKASSMFRFSFVTLGLFLATGFVGSYPYMVPSNIDMANGITIFDAMVGVKSMRVIFTAIVIFYPIVIGYQVWKYIKFTKKVKYNDE